jgi:hypothetical protein
VLDVRCQRCGCRFALSDDLAGQIPECSNCQIPYEVAPFGEQEWLAETDPNPMLSCLHGKVYNGPTEASDRKLRLFIANYCRRTWHLFQDERCRNAIEVVERYADGQVGDEELMQVYIEMSRFGQSNLVADSCRRAARMAGRITPRIVGIAAQNLVRAVLAESTGGESERGMWAWGEAEREAWEAGRRVQVDILREIFGNPFRPITLDPDWRTSTVTSLGEEIYLEKAFDLLGILGDALEDAGCNNREILDHCRSGGEHVRGCWAVDLVLDKE